MKHIKIYENAAGEVWTLSIKGLFAEKSLKHNYLITNSLFEIFSTRQDLNNYVINMMNDLYDVMMHDNDIIDDLKNNFKNISLETLEDCREFYNSLNYNALEPEIESEFEINNITPIKNVKVREDVKLKIDARKYNL
jgi:hypothetical protein